MADVAVLLVCLSVCAFVCLLMCAHTQIKSYGIIMMAASPAANERVHTKHAHSELSGSKGVSGESGGEPHQTVGHTNTYRICTHVKLTNYA